MTAFIDFSHSLFFTSFIMREQELVNHLGFEKIVIVSPYLGLPSW